MNFSLTHANWLLFCIFCGGLLLVLSGTVSPPIFNNIVTCFWSYVTFICDTGNWLENLSVAFSLRPRKATSLYEVECIKVLNLCASYLIQFPVIIIEILELVLGVNNRKNRLLSISRRRFFTLTGSSWGLSTKRSRSMRIFAHSIQQILQKSMKFILLSFDRLRLFFWFDGLRLLLGFFFVWGLILNTFHFWLFLYLFLILFVFLLF